MREYVGGDAASDYQLVDFGGGRKLERFGNHLVDRPSPAAADVVPASGDWSSADFVFHASGAGVGSGGTWQQRREVDPDWTVSFDRIGMNVRLTPGGQVGVFPEQAAMWRWIVGHGNLRAAKVLNLFGYTGGSSLAAAACGAQVDHVDAAKSVVRWARHNAQLNSAPPAIRWIVEDAVTFVRRQLRRGHRYDAVILDPPTFGRGPGGQRWSINRDLEPLLALLAQLTAEGCRLLLWTSHTPGFPPKRMRSLVVRHWPQASKTAECGWLNLGTPQRYLPAGAFARCSQP